MTKHIITSALPYVNNIPHLGNLVCIISADIYTRFLKQQKKEVISVLGTDEHGTTTETVALQKKMTCQEVTDHYYQIHKEIYEWFQCEFDCFGRTSSKENHEITQDIFLKLHKNGYITEQEIEQYFDETQQKFLSDRFIEGTCPNCKYEKARGDQCDNCQKLLNSTDLINPVSKISGSKPTLKKTKHLYIKLDQLQPLLQKELNTKNWSENAITTTNAWLKEGLKPRAITRDLNWGIKVPLKGYENKVFYVWFDAPIGYISITKATRNDWEEWWKNKDAKLIQFMGKDNIPFHSILFPSFCIGSNNEYTLINTINANEYLNFEDTKFSKSNNVGIFGDQAKKTNISSDTYRYYLTINRPEKSDTNFYFEDLKEKHNTELLGNFGNLVNRTLTFTQKYLDSKITTPTKKENYDTQIQEIIKSYEEIQLKKALKQTMNLSKQFNAYFQEQEPWQKIKENKEETQQIIGNLLLMIRDLAILLYPVIPATSKKVYEYLGLQKTPEYQDLKKDLSGTIKKFKPLFNKIEDEQINTLKKEYGPKQNLDLTVGKIIDIKKHPEADKLYIETIDFKDHQRQIISGLVEHYKPQELLNKKVIVVTNLKTAKLRGQKSEGMLLAAQQKKEVSILTTNLEEGTKILESNTTITIEEFLKNKLEYKNQHLHVNQEKIKQNIKSDKNINGPVKWKKRWN